MGLVEVAYFKQHTRAFQHLTPEVLFNSVSQTTSVNLPQQRVQHVKWLDEIRRKSGLELNHRHMNSHQQMHSAYTGDGVCG